MPSNIISINHQDNLSWEVPDSRMEAVITMLNGIGTRQDPDAVQDALVASREDHDKWHKLPGENECEECDGTGLNSAGRLEKATIGVPVDELLKDHPCKFCQGTGKQR